MDNQNDYKGPIVEVASFRYLDSLREQNAPIEVIAKFETELAERLVYIYDDLIRSRSRRAILDQAAELAVDALKYWSNASGDEATDFRYRLYGLLGNIDIEPAKNYLLCAENCSGVHRLECFRLAAFAEFNDGNLSNAMECTKAAIYTMLTVPVDHTSLGELFYVQQLVDHFDLYDSMKAPLDIVVERFKKLEVDNFHDK